MVGHESVDPKPQEKSVSVNGVYYILKSGLFGALSLMFYKRSAAGLRRKGIRF